MVHEIIKNIKHVDHIKDLEIIKQVVDRRIVKLNELVTLERALEEAER